MNTNIKTRLHILLVEDNNADAELVRREVKKLYGSPNVHTVADKAGFIKALKEFVPDVILSDHTLPSFNSIEALTLLAKDGIKVPFILVTGTMSEEFAVTVMKLGASDYIPKNQLHRLPEAIDKAIEKYRNEKLRQKFLYEAILNEAYMQEAEHISNYGSWDFDMINKKLKLSKKAAIILGYAPGEPASSYENILKKIHVDDIGRLTRDLHQLKNNSDSTTYKQNIRVKNTDGSDTIIKLDCMLKYDIRKKLLRINGIVKDVTGLITLEEKIYQSEERFKWLAENINKQAIIRLSAGGTIMSTNNAVEKLFGYSDTEIMDRHISLIYDNPQIEYSELKRYLSATGNINRLEHNDIFAKKNGTLLTVHFIISSLNTQSGDISGFMMLINEITPVNSHVTPGDLILAQVDKHNILPCPETLTPLQDRNFLF